MVRCGSITPVTIGEPHKRTVWRDTSRAVEGALRSIDLLMNRVGWDVGLKELDGDACLTINGPVSQHCGLWGPKGGARPEHLG